SERLQLAFGESEVKAVIVACRTGKRRIPGKACNWAGQDRTRLDEYGTLRDDFGDRRRRLHWLSCLHSIARRWPRCRRSRQSLQQQPRFSSTSTIPVSAVVALSARRHSE